MNQSITTLLLIIISTNAFSQNFMRTEAKSSSGKIQFSQDEDNRIYLEASYLQDTFQVLLDSYTNCSHLPKKWVVKKWNLKKTPYRYPMIDFNNKRYKEKLRTMESISIEDTFFASNFYICPNKYLNVQEFGLFGTDFLDDLNWKIDFYNNYLLYDTESTFNTSNITIKNNFERNEFPWFMLQIDSLRQKVKVDLGAASEITLPVKSKIGKQLIAKYNLAPRNVKTGGMSSSDVTDTQYELHLDSILIQGIMIKDVNIRLSTNCRFSFIGCRFLERGILYLNYKNSKNEEREVAFELLQ